MSGRPIILRATPKRSCDVLATPQTALHDSLELLGAGRNRIIASAIGTMTNGAHVELILWANGGSITYLELEPYPEAEDDRGDA